MATKSLTVAEYSDVVIRKYLQGAFSSDLQANRIAAADELYVLLRKLMDAAGGKSEDAKAPLKAIRNAIESVASRNGDCASKEIDMLFGLYKQLQELCVERVSNGTDCEGGQLVEDVLRYRLIRLVTGDTWDARPEFKLRVLKLIFVFMVRDNERLVEEGRDVPSLKLGRTLSLGRGRSPRDLGPRRVSKWADTLSEVGRMPGNKLLPLVKLLLVENVQIKGLLNEGQKTAVDKAKEAEKKQGEAGPSLLNDLLGIPNESGVEGNSPAAPQSHRSSSCTPSTGEQLDDPFAVLAEGRSESRVIGGMEPNSYYALQREFNGVSIGGATPGKTSNISGLPVRAPSPTSSTSSFQNGSGPSCIQTPPASAGPMAGPQYSGTGGGHFSHAAGYALQSHGSGNYSPSPLMSQGSGNFNIQSGLASSQGVQTWGIDNSKPAPWQTFETNFDSSSPYFGVPNPFGDGRFQDVAPLPSSNSGLPAAPPMRPEHLAR